MALQDLAGRSHGCCQWCSGRYVLQRGVQSTTWNSGVFQTMSLVSYKVPKSIKGGVSSF